MSRSPSRDRSQSRAGRTLTASGGGAGAPAEPTPVAAWTPTETSGTTLTDTVGGVALTLEGDAAFAASGLHSHAILYSTATGQAKDLSGGGTAPTPSTSITVMCWVRTGNPTPLPNDYGEVMGKSTTTYNTYGLLAHYGSGKANTPTFQYRTTNNAGEISASSALLADNDWHHLAGTYDGTTVKLYCDGVQVASASVTGALVYEPTDRLTFLGNDRFGNQLVASAAEFAIYDVALTAGQVQTAMG